MAAFTSSSRVPDRVERTYAVPASPATRAAAASARGKNIRLLPKGARTNGRSSVVPSTVVRRSHAGRGHGRPWAQRHLLERPTVLPQRDLGLGAAIDVVEDDARQTPLGKAPEVRDVDDAIECHSTTGTARPDQPSSGTYVLG